MARIDIKESSGARGETKSPSPVRKAPLAADKKATETLNSDSGYFEGEDDASLQSESSVEIIFDKNASNNNVGASGNKNSGI